MDFEPHVPVVASAAAEAMVRIRSILGGARNRAMQAVNTEMVAAYWRIGCEIVEREQVGVERAGYGKALIDELTRDMTAEFGNGYSARNLRRMRRFYSAYKSRDPEIWSTVWTKFESGDKQGFLSELSWSHYRELVRIDSARARDFYEVECARQRWSVRTLQERIGSSLYERLSASRDKERVLELARGQEAMWLMLQQDSPEDYVIATGEMHTVREFVELVFGKLALDHEQYVKLDPRYMRPTEVDALQGDASKARTQLGWVPRISFTQLVDEMVAIDVTRLAALGWRAPTGLREGIERTYRWYLSQ